ncbi:MAG TPA: GGDEF domain-containing protein, partial [Thermoanaerobaculia bacterium]|nr:GGDEF domain-containing protein [Thermoanaerobaculia bacterium]
EQEVDRLGSALAEADRRLENAARTDFLTGLPNRRRFLERAESERQALRRTGRGFALIRVDLDHLRAINRRYGSECGDRVLVAVASTLRDTLRERDVAARWGSEEFVLLLPETDLDGARTLAEKVRSRIASLRVVHGDRELEVTCTLGLSEADLGDSIDALAARADAALVAGKSAGGDRVEVWTPETPAGG